MRWLHDIAAYARLTLMFQKEVARAARRARRGAQGLWPAFGADPVAVPGRAGLRHAAARLRAAAQGDLDRGRSSRRARRRSAPCRLDDLERVTAAAFGQRRKMLRQSLKTLGGDTAALLAATGIAPTARAEELSVEQFCALAACYAPAAQAIDEFGKPDLAVAPRPFGDRGSSAPGARCRRASRLTMT